MGRRVTNSLMPLTSGVGGVNSFRRVNSFGSVGNSIHQQIMAQEKASFSRTTTPSVVKKLSLSEIRAKLAKKRFSQSGKKIGFKEAAKRAGFSEKQLPFLMDAYKDLLLKFDSIPLEKLDAAFFMYNLPRASDTMKSIPNSVIVAFANFAVDNRNQFIELQRNAKKATRKKGK